MRYWRHRATLEQLTERVEQLERRVEECERRQSRWSAGEFLGLEAALAGVGVD